MCLFHSTLKSMSECMCTNCDVFFFSKIESFIHPDYIILHYRSQTQIEDDVTLSQKNSYSKQSSNNYVNLKWIHKFAENEFTMTILHRYLWYLCKNTRICTHTQTHTLQRSPTTKTHINFYIWCIDIKILETMSQCVCVSVWFMQMIPSTIYRGF